MLERTWIPARNTAALVFFVVALGLLPRAEQTALGAQSLAEEGTSSDSAALTGGGVDAGDLDSLLEAAEKDVSQLSRVNVAAPALQTEVSTVSRQTSTVGRSPAAVFVVSNEMIRRSGARCIPEVLRMVPGVNVARIDANKWAVSVRGFNGRFANKLLVQIDGRSVYTPLYGGVFWDVQDVVLEDVERIEVIRGPGATVWGANAVNGVINIITKTTDQTQGSYVQGGAGTEQRGFTTARYGGRLGENAHYRVYGKWFERDSGFAPGDDAHDDWRLGRGGFRTDWQPSCCDTVTLQGDYYQGKTGRRNYYPAMTPPTYLNVVDDDARVAGGNVLFRWSRELDEDSDWSLQLYYDRTEREYLAAGFSEDRDTIDLDFQRRFLLGQGSSIIWGLGYRNTKDNIRGIPFVLGVNPNKRAVDRFSCFVADQITLREDLLYFTVGSKFEHNDYTGFEYQPTARLLWTPSPRHSIWTAISRAVRTPARIEDDMRTVMQPVATFPVPVFPMVLGNRGMQAEDLLAYEAGIRVQPTDSFSWDLAVFFNDYDDLMGVPMGPPILGFPTYIPMVTNNSEQGQTYGFELTANYQVTPCWRTYGAYSFLRLTGDGFGEGDSPRNQIYLQSTWDLCRNWEFDLAWRYVDRLPEMAVAGYNAMDARLAWHARPSLELAVVGRHLLDAEHPEFGADQTIGNVTTEVQQEVYGSVTWRY